MLDDGRLTDGHGWTVNFSNTVIILTSNLGAEYLLAGLSGRLSMHVAEKRVMQQVNVVELWHFVVSCTQSS